jgi:hypothetical protein
VTVTTGGLDGKINSRREQSDGESRDDFVSDGECSYSRVVGDPEGIEMGTERVSAEKSACSKLGFSRTKQFEKRGAKF